MERSGEGNCVPNAPCGVERTLALSEVIREVEVPNAPCGVERPMPTCTPLRLKTFLMHRVELKVPTLQTMGSPDSWFLMHRVELKG